MFKNIFILLFILGCQTTPPLTPQQRRTLQTRIYNAPYETVFRAFKTVMQDEGYIVKNQDMLGGLIVSETQKNMGSGYNSFLVLGALADGFSNSSGSSRNNTYATGKTFTSTVNLEEVRKNVVEARLIFQTTVNYSGGGQTGREIVDPEVYRSIFVKVNNEVERRKTLKR